MLQVSNLQFSYQKNQEKVIKGIDFTIHEGQVFGFLGPSGAGKTTVQRIIIGLLEGYEGSVSIMGKERKDWNREFFEKIGVAFDFPNLYSKLTAKENLALLGSYYKKKGNADMLLDQVGLSAYRDQKVETFSKGMKMRLNFIRSILHDPNFLFFDEPTSGLDPLNAKIIKDMIKDLKSRGKTIFLTTHNMAVAEQLCDTVSFIVDGRLPVTESPATLKMDHGTNIVHIEFFDNGIINKEAFTFQELKNNPRPAEIIRDYDIKTIHSQEATLEDVFIAITGRELL